MASLDFKRGDLNVHYVDIPADSWSASGRLFFKAKPKVDDDTTDAAAVISGEFTDANIISNDGTTVRYELSFPPSATSEIPSNGQEYVKYKGEIQFVANDGTPSTWPGKNNFIEVIVYMDIIRSTT